MKKVQKNKYPKKNEEDSRRGTGELKIKAALREKDAVIKGIHHRFINHLNLIYNILYFQKQYNKDDLHCHCGKHPKTDQIHRPRV